MTKIFETLFGLHFCKYECGAYIGFSDSEMSFDGQSHKPLEAKTGEIHDCPKEGWSKQKNCFQCHEKIIFHNSHKNIDGKKIKFDSPGVRHSCTQQSHSYQNNDQNEYDSYHNENRQQFTEIDDEMVIEAFAVFQLSHNSTIDQIKSKYREFVLKYHPDKNKSANANAMMIKINYAYEVIMKWWDNHV